MELRQIIALPGDGVGPEMIDIAEKILLTAVGKNAGLSIQRYPFGRQAFLKYGAALPPQTLSAVENAQIVLMGALDVKDLPSPSPVGYLRNHLNLYADVRSAHAFPNVWAVNPKINIVCIREATEGFLADRNLAVGYGEFAPTHDTIISLRVVTKAACERISRFAFEYATNHGRRKVTALHKGNVLKMGDGLFLKAFYTIATEYPAIEAADAYIDDSCQAIILEPENYDVLLTTNLFGDLLSDELSGLVSGLMPVENYGPHHAFFMAMNHQPKAEMAGKDLVDPMSMILTCERILEYAGFQRAARKLQRAVEKACESGVMEEKLTSLKLQMVCSLLKEY